MSINDPRRTNRFEDEEVAKERRPNRVYFLSNTYTPSSTRRDCSIISISRVNRCNPLGPWPRFRGTVLRVRPRGGGGSRTMRRHSKRTKGGEGGAAWPPLALERRRGSRGKENKRRSRIDHEKVARFKSGGGEGCSLVRGPRMRMGGGCLRGVPALEDAGGMWRIWNMGAVQP